MQPLLVGRWISLEDVPAPTPSPLDPAAPVAPPVDPSVLDPSAIGASPGGGSSAVGPSPGDGSSDAAAGSVTAAFIDPGSSAVLTLDVAAPTQPGRYLLVIDLLTSNGLSLAAAGVPPALIRVVVVAQPVDPGSQLPLPSGPPVPVPSGPPA